MRGGWGRGGDRSVRRPLAAALAVVLLGSLLAVVPVGLPLAEGPSEAGAQQVTSPAVLHRTEIVEGQTRAFQITNIPTRPEYYLHTSVSGSFTAEAGDITATTANLRGAAQQIPPDAPGPRAYPDSVYRNIRFEVTANADSDGTDDETFGVRLCTTADCSSGTVLGEWTVTVTEPAADTTLSGTGATLTVHGGSVLSVMEDSANGDGRDRRAAFEITLASAPTQDIVVVASTTTGVRTGSSSMGPFARINSSLSRDYPAAGAAGHDAVRAEYVVGYWPSGATDLSREFTVISTDNAVDTAGGTVSGNLTFRVLQGSINASDGTAYNDSTANNAAVVSGISIPSLPVRVTDDDEPTRVRLLPASTPDNTATEGNTDKASVLVRLDRALVAGEEVTAALTFSGAALGTNFSLAAAGGQTGVSYADSDDGTGGLVTLAGAGVQEGVIEVTALTDGDSVSQTLQIGMPPTDQPWRPSHHQSSLAGGVCAAHGCPDRPQGDPGQRFQSVTLAEAVPGLAIIEHDDPHMRVVTEGDGYSYDIRLNTQPTSDVTVTTTISSGGAVNAGGTLTFTNSNWATPQTVTVTPTGNRNDEPRRTMTVTHAFSGDTAYAALADVAHQVSVLDDDPTTITMAGTGVRDPNNDATAENISRVMVEGDATLVDRTLTLTLSRALVEGEYVRVPLRLEAVANGNIPVIEEPTEEEGELDPPDHGGAWPNDIGERRVVTNDYRGVRASANVAWPPQHNDFVMTATGTGVSYEHSNRYTPNHVGFRYVEFRGAGAQAATIVVHAKDGFDDGETYDEAFAVTFPNDFYLFDSDTDNPLSSAPVDGNLGGGIRAQPAGAQGWFGITDKGLDGIDPSLGQVPRDWPLLPPGLTIGDKFRLLYVTTATTAASEVGYAYYNDFVRAEITGDQLKQGGVPDLKPYADHFAAVISANSATDNPGGNATNNAKLEDAGNNAAIYWMGGAKAADDTADFLDGDWDDEANPKHADASAATISASGYWTGSEFDGQRRDSCGGTAHHLRAGSSNVNIGKLGDATLTPLGPATNAQNCATAPSHGELLPLYALSTREFTVVGGASIETAQAAEGSPITFTVTIPDAAPAGGITVPYTLADGRGVTSDPAHIIAAGTSGGTGADYDNDAGTVVIAQGQTSNTFTVNTTNDSTYEGDHYLTVTLGAPTGTNAPIIDPTKGSAIGIIEDDADAPSFQFSPATATAGEGDGTATLTVTKTGTTLVPASVYWTTADGTGASAATHPDDYTANAGYLQFAPGDTSKTVTIDIVDDDTGESAETFKAQLSQPSEAQIGSASEATVTVTDDDGAAVPVVQFKTASSRSFEGQPFEFPYYSTIVVEAESAVEADTVVSFTLGGTAVRGSDYTIVTATSISSETILEGETEGEIVLRTLTDDNHEADETIVLTLVAGDGYDLGSQTTHTVTIRDLPDVEFAAATSQGVEGETVTVTVRASHAFAEATDVTFTLGGTATSADYTAPTSPVRFGAGDTTATLSIPVTADTDSDAGETIILTLVDGDGYDAGPNTRQTTQVRHTITLFDATSVEFSDAVSTAKEGTTATVTVQAPRAVAEDTAVAFTVAGSAQSGDFTAPTSPVTIRAGQTSAEIEIPIAEDSPDDSGETIILTLTDGDDYSLGGQKTHTVTLAEADPPPDVEFAASVSQGREGATVSVRVDASRALDAAYSVSYTSTGGTATAGSDYTALSGSFTMPAGAASAAFDVAITADNASDAGETIILTLTDGDDYNLGSRTGHTVTITESDPPTLVFTQPRVFIAEGGASARYGISLSHDPSGSSAALPACDYDPYTADLPRCTPSADPVVARVVVTSPDVGLLKVFTGGSIAPAGEAVLEFTRRNFGTPQFVTVYPEADDDADSEQNVLIGHSIRGAADDSSAFRTSSPYAAGTATGGVDDGIALPDMRAYVADDDATPGLTAGWFADAGGPSLEQPRVIEEGGSAQFTLKGNRNAAGEMVAARVRITGGVHGEHYTVDRSGSIRVEGPVDDPSTDDVDESKVDGAEFIVTFAAPASLSTGGVFKLMSRDDASRATGRRYLDVELLSVFSPDGSAGVDADPATPDGVGLSPGPRTARVHVLPKDRLIVRQAGGSETGDGGKRIEFEGLETEGKKAELTANDAWATIQEGDPTVHQVAVELSEPPKSARDVVVTVAVSDPAKLALAGDDNDDGQVTLTFKKSAGARELTYRGTQTVGFAAKDDDDFGDEMVTVTVTMTSGYGRAHPDGTVVRTFTVRIEDDDMSAGVTVVPGSLTVIEGAKRGEKLPRRTDGRARDHEIAVRLDADPGSGVTVRIEPVFPEGITSPKKTLDFTGGTSGNWQTWQTIGVKAPDDGDFDDEELTVTWKRPSVTAGSSAAYTALTAADVASVAVTVLDDDAGVRVSERGLELVEGVQGAARRVVDTGDGGGARLGRLAAATYEVVLQAAPAAGEVVTVTPVSGDTAAVGFGRDDDGNAVTTHPGLVFTADDWDVPQTVTLAPVDDDDAVDESVTVTHSVSTTGSVYSAVGAGPSVTAAVLDDDRSEGIVVSSDGETFSGDGAVLFADEGGDAVGFNVRLAGRPAEAGRFWVDVSGGGAVVADADLGASGTQTALSFSQENWWIPQTVWVTAPDETGAGADADDGLVELSLTAAAVTNGTRAPIAAYGTTPVWVHVHDDEFAGGPTYTVTVAGTGAVTEGASPAVFTVQGDMVPSSSTDVTLRISETGDFVAAGDEGDQTVTFTTGAILTHQVPIVDDDVADDDGTITAALQPGSGYRVGDPSQASIRVADDSDTGTGSVTADLSVSGGGSVAEGGTLTVTVTLGGAAPSALSIPVRVASSPAASASAGDYTLPSPVTVAMGDTSGTLTFTAVDDMIAEDAETLTLELGTLPAGVTAGTTTSVAVTINDDDTAGVTVVESGGSTVVVENGGTDTYTVRLDSQPLSNVVVRAAAAAGVEVDGPAAGSSWVSQLDLTFTPQDWNSPQTVTVRGVNDSVVNAGGKRDVTITQTVHTGDTGGKYTTSTAVANVDVDVTDDDTAGVTVAGGPLTVSEDGTTTTDSYTVRLTSEPLNNVVVTATAAAGAQVSTDGGTTWHSSRGLTFNPSGSGIWSAAQTVHVRGVRDDIDNAGDRRAVSIGHAITSGNGDGGSYTTSTAIDAVSVTVTDDDTAGVTVAGGPLTVSEDGTTATDSYTVRLTSEPLTNVVVRVAAPAGVEVDGPAGGRAWVSQLDLTFTPSNWGTAQTVTVRGEDDDIDNAGDKRELTVAQSVQTGDTGGKYTASTSVANVDVDVTDDDIAAVTVAGGPLTVTEDRSDTDDYTVVLATQPVSNVTITATAPDGAQVSDDGGSTWGSSVDLVFTSGTSGNWGTAQTVTVRGDQDVIDNPGDRRDVTVTHSISSGNGDGSRYTPSTPSMPSVSVRVNDDDAKPTGISLSTGLSTVSEGAGSTVVSVTATVDGSTRFGTAKTVKVSVSSRADTASANYVDMGQVADVYVIIAAGARTGSSSFLLVPDDDAVDESDNSVMLIDLSVVGDSTVTVSAPAAPIALTDDDAAPTGITLTASLTSVTENGGAQSISVTATVNGSTTFGTAQAVAVSVTGHDAMGQVGFAQVSGFSVTIPAEMASATGMFTLTPDDNVWFESDGAAQISGTSPVTVTGASVAVTNDDAAPSGVTLSVSPLSLSEGGGAQTVTVTATVNGSTRYGTPRTVNVTTAGSGNAAAVDYTATAPAAITLAAGAVSSTTTFAVTPVDDSADEFDEVIAVSGSGAGIAAVAPASVALADDDDTTVSISASAAAVAENGGVADVTLTLSRALVSGELVAVPLDVVGASAGSDYTLALHPATQAGVALSVAGSDSAQAPRVVLTGGASSAVLRFAAVDDSTRTQPYVLVRYGAGARAPSGSGVDFAAPSDGPVGWVITDDETGDVVVPQSWALAPSGVLGQGEPRFRLVFVSSAERDASSTDIAEYDAFVRGLLAEGHADVVPYAGFFTVLGSTSGVHLRDHAGVTGSATMPFYWLGETGDATKRVATDNGQFRGEWIATETPSSQSVPRDESGTVVSVDADGYFTGSTAAGARSSNPLGSSNVTVGYLNDSGSGRAPLGSGQTASRTATRRFYGLSPVFVRASDPVVSVTTTQTSVAEGTALSFAVSADPAPPNVLTVRLFVSEEDGRDMVPDAQEGLKTISFAAGETSKTHTVTTSGDSTDEADAVVTVRVLTNAGYTVSSTADTATVTVADNDAMTVSASGGGGTVSEGASLDYTVDPGRNLAPGETVTVNFAPAGTATQGSDYTITCHGTGVSCTGLSGATPALTIAGGSGVRNAVIRVSARNDSVHPETGETAGISLRSGHSSTGSGGAFSVSGTPSTFTIASAAPAALTASFGAATYSAAEAAGSRTVTVPVSLSAAAPSGGLNVSYTVGGSAVAADHGTLNGTVSFAQGATAGSITVTVVDDVLAEGPETIVLTITDGADYDPGATAATTITINDNDVAPTNIALSVDDSSVGEGDGATAITVTATVQGTTRFADAKSVAVMVSGSGGAGVVGFTAAPSTFSIPIAAGARTGTGMFTLTPTDDSAVENDETVTVAGTLSGTTVASATVTVTDDDTAAAPVTVTLSAAGGDVVEGAAGASGRKDVTVALGRALTGSETVTVPLSVQGAAAGSDYSFGLHPATQAGVALVTSNPHSAQNPAVRFSAGATTAVLRFSPVNNAVRTQPYVVIGYGSGARAPGGGGGATLGAVTGGPFGFVVVDDETGDITVPSSWGLAPSGLGAGDDFRLLFRTSTTRDAASSDIADYDVFVRNVLASGGHADIVAYAGFFKAFASTRSSSGSTGTTARVHVGLASGHTGHFNAAGDVWADGSTVPNAGNTAGTPVWWLGGAKLANNYADLCDQAVASGSGVTGGWGVDDPRSETGSRSIAVGVTAGQAHQAWTGTGNSCEAYSYPLGNSTVSRAASHDVTWAFMHEGHSARSQQRPLYAMSPVFRIAGAAAVPVADFASATSTAAESAGTRSITVNLVPAPSSSVMVAYTLSGTAVRGSDYTISGVTSNSGTVTVGPSGTATIPVAIADDSTPESAETVILTLTGGSGYTVGAAVPAHTLTVVDNDTAGLPRVSFVHESSSVSEHDIARYPSFTISPAPAAPLTVRFAIDANASTAALGADYRIEWQHPYTLRDDDGDGVWEGAVTAPATAPAYGYWRLPTVRFVDDSVRERDETIVMRLLDGAGYTLGAIAAYTVTIADNERGPLPPPPPPPAPQVSVTAGPAVDEGAAATFTLSASPPAAGTVSVRYTVTQNGRYVASGQLGSGKTRTLSGTGATISVPTLNDGADEADGSVTVTLTAGSGYVVGTPSSATVTVRDDDVPAAQFAAATSTAAESAGTRNVTVRLVPAPAQATAVSYALSGTAVRGSDYTISGVTSNTGTVTVGPSGAATIPVAVADDSAAESAETVILTLAAGAGYDLGARRTHTLTITDNDTAGVPQVTVTAGSAVDEGGAATFAVSASPAPSGTVSVRYTVTQNGQFVSSGRLGPNKTRTLSGTGATISIPTHNDSADEADGSVTVTLTAGSGYVVGTPAAATVTVRDNDVPTAQFAATASSADESSGIRRVRVNLSPAPHRPVTVAYTVGGSATRGTDFTATGSVSAPAGAAFVDIAVTVIDDFRQEPDETVILTLTGGAGYQIGARGTHTLTITDQDVSPTAAFATAADQASENAGTHQVTLTVQPAPAAPITVRYTISGTATRSIDYTAPTGTVTVPAGDTTAAVHIPITDDTANEGDETVVLTLTAPAGSAGYLLGSPTAFTLTIVDDDATPATPRVSFVHQSSSVSEHDIARYPSFTISPAPAAPITIHFAIDANASTATLGADYQITWQHPYTLHDNDQDGIWQGTITAPTTAPAYGYWRLPTIRPVNDRTREPNETIVLRLLNGPGYTLGHISTYTITITD
ncbi:Calx-beta domain-containing protein [Candidatus Poriferisodalis sp.]|uniref:Calx-beta domain-containing protein n=1 Tax=Candidatus Poriferisodalis sp. TaxID=3101277 RepID=UPI003B5A9D5E